MNAINSKTEHKIKAEIIDYILTNYSLFQLKNNYLRWSVAWTEKTSEKSIGGNLYSSSSSFSLITLLIAGHLPEQ